MADKIDHLNISRIPADRLPGMDEFLWDLLRERASDPTIAISSLGAPSIREHLTFLDSHPYRAWWIVTLGGAWIGTVSITQANEIGVHILKEYRGHGYARQAVERMMAYYTPERGKPALVPGRFVANINPKNESSIALFESLGAKLIQVTYQLPQPGEDHGQGQAETA